MEHQIVFMSLDIDREGVETIDKSLVSEFLLPLTPLIIEDVVKGRNGISLLPLV